VRDPARDRLIASPHFHKKLNSYLFILAISLKRTYDDALFSDR